MCFRFRFRPSSEIGARTPEWRNPLRLKPAPSAQPRFRSVFRFRSRSPSHLPSVPFRSAVPSSVPRLPNPNLDSISELKPSESVYAHSSTTQRTRRSFSATRTSVTPTKPSFPTPDAIHHRSRRRVRCRYPSFRHSFQRPARISAQPLPIEFRVAGHGTPECVPRARQRPRVPGTLRSASIRPWIQPPGGPGR